MALNIPNVDSPGNSFLKGIDTGSSMFSRMMQPIIEREKQKQQAAQFAQELALKKQILNWKHKNDPQYALQQLQSKLDYIQGLNTKSGQGNSSNANSVTKPKDGVTLEGEQWYNAKGEPVYAEEGQKAGSSGLNMEEIKRGLTYKALGLPVPRTSTSGITPEMREREFLYKQKSLDERMRHNQAMEKLANPDEKIRLAQEKANIESEKQKNIADFKADLEYKKSLNKEEGKTFAKMEQDAMSGVASQPVLKEVADVISDPLFEQIRQHPYLGHQEFGYYKRSGTAEQKALIARFDVATNKLIADTAKGLNSRFTDKDLALAQNMKLNDTDSLEAARAKAEALMYLHDLGQKRLEKAIEIASTQRVSPFIALKQADNALNSDEIRANIKSQIYKNSDKLPPGITEADITTTIQETGMTRAQVLEAYRKKKGV